MSLMYLIPLVAIAGSLVYVFWYRAKLRDAVAAGHGPIMFHNTYAGMFPSFGPEERIVALWQGLAYVGSQGTAARVGSAVLNEISSKTIGVSTYTPYVFAALTSGGRLVVAEEFSELGDRGQYKEVCVWAPGASAVTGAAAVPGHAGSAPSNPFNPAVPLELAALVGPDGSRYACWLSTQSLEVTGQQRPIGAVLPISPEAAAAVWNTAVQQAQPQQPQQS